MNQDLTVNRIYSQCITPPREGPGGGRKTHLQVESLLPRLSTDSSEVTRFEGFGFSGVWSQEYQDWLDMFCTQPNVSYVHEIIHIKIYHEMYVSVKK